MTENVSEIAGAIGSGSDDVSFREAGILIVTFAHQRRSAIAANLAATDERFRVRA